MAIPVNRVKLNNGVVANFLKSVQLIFKRFLIIIFIILSIYFLYFAKPKQLDNITLEITGRFISFGVAIYEKIFSPILFISEKLTYFQDLKAENLILKLELARLHNFESYVETIKSENLALKNLLNVVDDKKYNYITARLLSVSLNPFSKSVLIGAGVKDGVEVNQIVSNEYGLLGRIIQVSDHYSKVMLINDFNSRIPVVTLLTHERGILAGNNINAQILYLQKNHSIKKGESLITSGDGAIYPRGIVVAKISHILGKEVIAEPIVNLCKTDFVSIYNANFTDREFKKN